MGTNSRNDSDPHWYLPLRCVAVCVSCAAGLAWLVFVPPAQAQTPIDGAITGQVVDALGDPVANARVTAREMESGLTLRSLSGKGGEFLLVRVPIGEYTVSVEATGAALTLGDPVAVGIGEVTEVEAHLREAPVWQPAQPAEAVSGAGRLLTEAELAALPENGDWRSMALTLPGAIGAAGDDGDAGEVSFRGSPLTQNSTRIDGASGDEGFSGTRLGAGVEEDANAGSDEVDDRGSGVGSGSRSVADGGQRAGSAFTFSSAGVREFRVQGQGDAATYGSALYGHGVGSVVAAASRSGGTRLHGMAFYTMRNSALAAANPFSVASTYANGVATSAIVKPLDVRQQFGGSVGGPVPWFSASKADHGSARMRTDQGPGRTRELANDSGQGLFYFIAFEEQRRNFPAISSPGYSGFYTLTATQTALLANRGVSPAKTSAALTYLNSLTGTVARTSNQLVYFGRVDWQRRGGSRVVLEYNQARWNSPGGARSGAVVDRGTASIGSSYGAVDAGVARWVQFFKHHLSNEVRAEYAAELQYETAQPPLAQEPNIGPGGMPPEISIGPDGFVFGTPAALGQHAYPQERRIEAADIAAWTHGRHFIQLGGDFSALNDLTDSLTDIDGTFNYDSGVTGGKAGGLADWITDYTFNVNAYPNGGCPSIAAAIHDFCFRSYSQSFGQQSVTFSTQEWAGFAQDDWRVSRQFTLHLGVRYEYELLPFPQQPNAALDALFGTVGATSVFPEDRNNFGPRVGFQWAPFGRGNVVIRAGYGVYFGKLPGATIRAALLDTAMPASTTRVRITPKTETACPQMTMVGFGYPCAYVTQPPAAVAATTSAMVFSRRFRMPMVQQATLSLEEEIAGGVLGRVEFTGNLDRQLPDSVDINIAPSTGLKQFQLQGGTGAAGAQDGELFAVPAYSERATTSFGPVTDILSNANASYNGLTVEARRGLGSARSGYEGASRGLEFRAAWTWSKAIDYGQNAGAVPRSSGQFDPFTIRYDKGLSALDFPHRMVATAVWSPRVTGSESYVSATAERSIWKLADGWSLGAIFSEASGRGYSYDVFGGTRLAGGRESINGSGGSVVLPTAGRNTLRLPDTMNLDIRLSRSFRLRERLHLRGAIEAFNLTNRLNLSGVTQRAYLVGVPGVTTPAGVIPLVFQNAANIAIEGLNTLPFGAYTAAATSQARERQVQMGLRLEF